jgi:hypothetical protein
MLHLSTIFIYNFGIVQILLGILGVLTPLSAILQLYHGDQF